MSAAFTDLNPFLDGFMAGWRFKYGGAIEAAAGLEDIQCARGFSEAEVKDFLESLQSVGALPFRVYAY